MSLTPEVWIQRATEVIDYLESHDVLLQHMYELKDSYDADHPERLQFNAICDIIDILMDENPFPTN